MNTEKICKKLVELRGARSQEQVARDLGISTSAMVKYENGERIPRDEVKLKIAEYYQCAVQDIFFI